jgi:hypothetical protein
MQEKPSDRNSRAVPRAIASAVSDWRRSNGGTRLIWRAGDSMVVNPIRFRSDHTASDAKSGAKPAINLSATRPFLDLSASRSRGNPGLRDKTLEEI